MRMVMVCFLTLNPRETFTLTVRRSDVSTPDYTHYSTPKVSVFAVIPHPESLSLAPQVKGKFCRESFAVAANNTYNFEFFIYYLWSRPSTHCVCGKIRNVNQIEFVENVKSIDIKILSCQRHPYSLTIH